MRYAKAGNTTYYPFGETTPDHKGTLKDWADLVYRTDTRGRRRVARMVYDIATFQTLREQLRRHGTTMKVEGDYVDSYGESEPGFGVTRLLNVDLLPRIKQINRVKLHQADYGDLARYANLAPAMTRPVRWDIIAKNYDQVVKYALRSAVSGQDGSSASQAWWQRS